jgi:putative transposase
VELVVRKAAVEQVGQGYAFSQRRACGLLSVAVSSYRYQTRRLDEPLRRKLVELAREKPRFGYRRLHVLLRRSGETVNHKRVHRVYREAGLSIRRKKRKHCVRVGQPLRARTEANQEWALDFVHDTVDCGRAIRVLSVVDAYTRECLVLEVDTSFTSRRVTRALHTTTSERLTASLAEIPSPPWLWQSGKRGAFSKGAKPPSFPQPFSPPLSRANSSGVRYPKLLCGRSRLYSIRQAAIFRRASNRFPNQLTRKHSSRSLP